MFKQAIIAQKPAIQFATCRSWPFVSAASISDNGLFVMFTIENEPLGNHTLVIKSSDAKWEKKMIGASSAMFINNSSEVSFARSDGTSAVLNLRTRKERTVSSSTAISSITNKIEDSIDDYILTSKGDGMLLKTKRNSGTGTFSLLWYDLLNKTMKHLWSGTLRQDILLDHDNADSNVVLFELKEAVDTINPQLANVDVWSYKDAKVPAPFSQRETESIFNYAIRNHQMIQLTFKDDFLISVKGDFALVHHNAGNNPFEASWNEKARSSFYLVSLKDGSRKLIMKQQNGEWTLAIQTPDGKNVIIGDQGKLGYLAYNIKTDSFINLSKNTSIYNRTIDMGIQYLPFDITWLSDSAFIVNDEYDLWKIDITGKIPPVNITDGYGRSNNITFRFLQISGSPGLQSSRDYNGYLLNAFDQRDKSWGFYRLPDLSGKTPVKLNMGQYYYSGEGTTVTRAKNARRYIVMRETASESRNLFITDDFKKFIRLSDVAPERDYNWMSTELIKWNTYSDRVGNGLLCKPENFDPQKKYPVVVMVYNQFTDKKNKFITVENSEFGGPNFLPVAWLVSNGYLVFIPDVIHRKQGERLKDSYEMVVSGVEYIQSLPYVNKEKIGLEGASWGGEQVNYIISHTNIFAAAFTGAGYSERISDYGFLDQYKQWSNSMANEINLSGSFIDVSEIYIKEAALFSADKVNTPLLIKHNKDDRAVPFYQGFQFFNILRRLGKKVWMLQYEMGDHGVRDGADKEDMHKRISQFFDHYLKDQPAPFWMTEGIAPERKQIDSGLELDIRN